jgi:hypothetical protein
VYHATCVPRHLCHITLCHATCVSHHLVPLHMCAISPVCHATCVPHRLCATPPVCHITLCHDTNPLLRQPPSSQSPSLLLLGKQTKSWLRLERIERKSSSFILVMRSSSLQFYCCDVELLQVTINVLRCL